MIRLKRYAAILILIIGCNIYNGFSQLNADTVLSLKQCVDIAISNNTQVKQSELIAQTDYVGLRQAKDNRLPAVAAIIGQGINQGRSIDPFSNSYINQNVGYGNYNLSADFNLFSGGQIKNNIREYKFLVNADNLDLQQVKENITLNIILAYLQILNNEDLVRQSKSQYTLTEQQVQRLEILNKEGAIIPEQLYELKGQLANDQLAIVTNENALDAARLTLSQLMNIPYRPIQVERIDTVTNVMTYEGDPASIYQSASSRFPSVKAAMFRRLSGEAAIKSAKGGFYPSIGIGGGITTNFSSAATNNIFLNSEQVPSGDYIDVGGTQVPVITTRSNFNSKKISYVDQFTNNYNTSLGINIRIPIINYNQARNRVALAKVQFKNAQYLEKTASIQLSQNIEQAYFNMTAAYKKYSTLKHQVEDFTEAYRIAEVRFNAGVSNQVEFLIAKNNMDNANINLIIARYDYIFRTKILDYYQGRLVL